MDPSTHIIDPNGELIIVLHNANSPFAHSSENDVPDDAPLANDTPEDDVPEDCIMKEQPCEQLDKKVFRIQVSAKHMMFASPFFKKCLTGPWKECETYQQKGLVQVPAEGWDSEALLIIIRAMHCQYNLIPKKVTLEMLAKIAVIADYYDCKDVLYIMTDIWFSSLDYTVTRSLRGQVLWLWVFWVFKRPKQFKKASSIVMSWSEGPIDVMGLPFPNQVIASMEKTRRGAIEDVMLHIHHICEEFLSGDRGCEFECKSIMYGSLGLRIRSSHLFSTIPVTPFPDMSYRDLIHEVLSFKTPLWYKQTGSHGIHICSICSNSIFEVLFAKFNHSSSIEGLKLEEFYNP